MSSGLISISISSLSNSGITSQEANDVWRLPDESKGEILTSRCTPFLLLSNRRHYDL